MLAEHESGWVYGLEIVFWMIPTLLALHLLRRSPKGTRMGWLIVGAACGAIVLDKAFDILSVVHQTGQSVVRMVDPDTRLRGENAIYRYLLLGALFGIGASGLVWSIRRDRDRGAGKVVAFVGLIGVLGYLAARLVPRFRDTLAPPSGWIVEGVCYATIVFGLLLGVRSTPKT